MVVSPNFRVGTYRSISEIGRLPGGNFADQRYGIQWSVKRLAILGC